MPNAIKYSTTGDTLSLKEGNIFFGVGDVGKGPSSATTYYNGVTPPSGGYTVYSYNVNQTSKLSFFTAVDGASLITYTNQISGQNFSTATECLNWYPTQTNFTCVNRDYESIITSGLTLCLDAGFTPSYSTSGVSWYDISYGGNNGTLTNGPTFDSSNGGIILFDGVNEYVNWNNNPISALTTSITYDAWIKFSGTVQNAFTLSSSNFKVYHQNDSAWYITGTGTGNRNISWTYITDWVNFVYSFDGTNHICYINGVSYTVNSGGGLSSQSNLQLCGRNSGDSPLKGNISITRVYNRGLTASEILQNYNAQKSRYIASFDADAQAFITAAGITDTTQQNAINTLVVGLKTDGLWTSMQAIYPFVGGTATTHKWNLRNTATNQLTFFGGFTHDSNGVMGNGTNSYATTNIYNSATLGIYSRSSNPTGAFVGKRKANEPVEGSQYNITESSLFGNVYNGNNGQYNLGASPYNKFYNVSNGVTGAANEVKVYRNGTNVVLSSSAGATPPSSDNEYYLFANPNEITFDDTGQTRIDIYDNSNANISLALFSNTTLDATQNTNLNNRVVTFQTALSRNV
jgi:hypothetical protein